MQAPNVMGAPAHCTWDFYPLAGDELRAFLAKKMPEPSEVGPDESAIEVVAKCSGKRLIVIPEDAREPVLRLFGFPRRYREFYGSVDLGDRSGVSIGACLQVIIDALAPAGSRPEGDTLFAEEPRDTEFPSIYVVLVTKRHLVFIRVPRDVECAVRQKGGVDPRAEKARAMQREREEFRREWKEFRGHP